MHSCVLHTWAQFFISEHCTVLMIVQVHLHTEVCLLMSTYSSLPFSVLPLSVDITTIIAVVVVVLAVVVVGIVVALCCGIFCWRRYIYSCCSYSMNTHTHVHIQTSNALHDGQTCIHMNLQWWTVPTITCTHTHTHTHAYICIHIHAQIAHTKIHMCVCSCCSYSTITSTHTVTLPVHYRRARHVFL